MSLLGVDLPKNLLPTGPDNPLGFWEASPVLEAHNEFLEAIGSSYDDVLSIDASCLASAKATAFEDRLVDILEHEFGDSPLFVVKDPRICRIIPLWLNALERFGAEPAFILQIRNPLEVAASLKERNGFSLNKGLVLWLRHVLEAERDTRLLPRVIVSYEDLVRDWRSVTDRIARELSLVWPRTSHAASAQIEEFLSPCRRHHVFEPIDVETRADVVDWVKASYGALRVAASSGGVPTDVLDWARADLDRADAVFGPLMAETRLLAANERDRLRAEAEGLAADRDNWRSKAEALEADHDERRSEAEALQADRDQWRSEAERLQPERDELREQADALSAHTSKLDAEMGRLRDDRDNWRREAQNWRAETERLIRANERRLLYRARRLARRLARRVWWTLPRAVRDRLRPILFRTRGVGPTGSSAAPARPADAAVGLPPPRPKPASRPSARRGSSASEVPAVQDPVSVVIPTLNAGPEFARSLARLSKQVGLDSLELLVVDSGSTDGTPDVAREAGARLVEIPAEQFGHGATRNRAIEVAEADVILLLVQDAVPLGRTALRDLVLELLGDPRLAGVSARQVARSDADLYGAFVTWAHHDVIRSAQGSLDGRKFERLDPFARRAAAALDNVCAALRRSAWEDLRFADVGFAEDLDFAVRGLRRGWNFALSSRAAVAHSHDRDSVYHLRRSVADRLFVAPLVGETVSSRAACLDVPAIGAAARDLLDEIAGAVSLATEEEPGPLAAQVARVASTLDVGAPRLTPEGELAHLASFLETEAGRGSVQADRDALRADVIGVLQWPPLERFARTQRAVAARDTSAFVAKLTAGVVGRAMGESIRARETNENVPRLLTGV